MKVRVATSLFVAGILTLTACTTGDDGQSGEPPAPEPPPAATRDEFAALLETSQDSAVRVTYRFEDGTAEPTETEEIIFSQSPPRVAVRTKNGVVIDNGDGSLASCTEGDEPVCVRLPGVGDAGQGLLSGFLGVFASLVFDDSPSDLAGYTPEDGRVIADRPAVCAAYATTPVTVSPTAGEVRLTECVDADVGVALLLVAENEEGTIVRLEALEVDTPEATDFEAPAPENATPGT